jgi:cell division septal protein FtsQ
MRRYKDELKTKKRKKLIFRLASFCIVVIAGFAGLIYALFFAKLLDIRTVIIEVPEGLSANISSAVDNWLNAGTWKFTRRNNILFFSTNKLSSQLVGQFSKLESIKISKKLPHFLVISGIERKPVGVWCLSEHNQCFYFDKNGIAFNETQPSVGFLILNIVDQRSRELKLGDEVIAQDWLSNITKAKELLGKIDVNVSEFIISADSFEEFYAKTVEGRRILFSNATDIEKQISALGTFLKEKLSPNQKANLQYIDLRIQDRIYYK